MYKTALKVLRKLEEHGFKAYIVGGFVRDYLLGISSTDIDIATDAKPMDIKKIFKGIVLPNEEYGSITIMVKNIRFELTTFRKELSYINNRKPGKIEYINELLDDLLRRDFTINTICMNSSGEIIDLLNGKQDLLKKEINIVGNSYDKFNEDLLRILRAIRFATTLGFKLSDDIKEAILKTKHKLCHLSYQRKRQELDRIFTNSNSQYGVDLLLELGLDKELELYNLKDISLNTDLIGIWASLHVSEKYPFTTNEKELIKNIKLAYKEDNLNYKTLYKYGLYVNIVAGSLKNISKKQIVNKYNKLPIVTKKDICISSYDIMEILNKKSGQYIGIIQKDIENKILEQKLSNTKEYLRKYILDNYS